MKCSATATMDSTIPHEGSKSAYPAFMLKLDKAVTRRQGTESSGL